VVGRGHSTGSVHPEPPGRNHLSRIIEGADRSDWEELVPSLHSVVEGPMLWVLVGDVARVAAKYGGRAG
jgi:hypothetical protein